MVISVKMIVSNVPFTIFHTLLEGPQRSRGGRGGNCFISVGYCLPMRNPTAGACKSISIGF